MTHQRPKVIIVCGCDNCGKDTLIAKLSNYYDNKVCVLHSSVPNTDNLFKFYHDGIIHKTLDEYYYAYNKAIIHNRSMYGEYVYGPKYRHENKDYVLNIINKLELGQLKTFIFNEDLYFILLTSSSVSLLENNDDGLSLSNRHEDIADEIASFNEIFSKSTIVNKKRVFVNNGFDFRNPDDIYHEVLNFIENN